jgi:hypothetical protein
MTRRSFIFVAALTLAGLFNSAGSARAGDAEDARDLVGVWVGTGFLVDTVEFRADGTYKFKNGGGGKWRVMNGMIVTETIFGVQKSEFTLGRDSLTWGGETRKRK